MNSLNERRLKVFQFSQQRNIYFLSCTPVHAIRYMVFQCLREKTKKIQNRLRVGREMEHKISFSTFDNNNSIKIFAMRIDTKRAWIECSIRKFMRKIELTLFEKSNSHWNEEKFYAFLNIHWIWGSPMPSRFKIYHFLRAMVIHDMQMHIPNNINTGIV